jgi:ERCC4-type nuclease
VNNSEPFVTPFTVIVDTREQAPYSFLGYTETVSRTVKGEKHSEEIPVVVRSIVRGLPTGDYSLEGYEDRVSIERKSIPDFVSTITAGRERFVRELERGEEFEFFAVLVEGTLDDCLAYTRDETEASPKSVYRSVIAFEIDFRARFIFETSRARAERRTFLALRKFWERKQ